MADEVRASEIIKKCKARKRKKNRIGHLFEPNGAWFVRYYTGEVIPAVSPAQA